MVCTSCDNPRGQFTYPPLVDNLQFNYADTIRAQWETEYADDDDCVLSLYYWLNEDPWLMSNFNKSVPCTGTEDIPLNLENEPYLAQLNLNHTGAGEPNIIRNGLFNVEYEQDQEGKLWQSSEPAEDPESQPQPDPTQSSSLLPTQTGMPPTLTRTSVPARQSSGVPESSQGPGGEDSGLGGGALAGIVIGVVLGLLLVAGGAFILWRKRKRARAQPGPYSSFEPGTETAPMHGATRHNGKGFYADEDAAGAGAGVGMQGTRMAEKDNPPRQRPVELGLTEAQARPSELP